MPGSFEAAEDVVDAAKAFSEGRNPFEAFSASVFSGGTVPKLDSLSAPTHDDLLEVLGRNQEEQLARQREMLGPQANMFGFSLDELFGQMSKVDQAAITELTPKDLQTIGALRAAIKSGDEAGIDRWIEEARYLGNGEGTLGHLFKPLELSMQSAGLTPENGYEIARSGTGSLGVKTPTFERMLYF